MDTDFNARQVRVVDADDGSWVALEVKLGQRDVRAAVEPTGEQLLQALDAASTKLDAEHGGGVSVGDVGLAGVVRRAP